MRLHTKIVAGFLAAVMIVASTATTNVHAATKKTVTVSTQAQIDKALANKKVAKIVVKTEKSVKIAISPGDYKDKQLLVDSPKITISNKGNFKSIVITDAKKVSDSAKGNKITLKDTNGLTFCATKASKDTKINIAAKNTKVDLVIDGKPKEIKISAKSSVVIDGNTKAVTPVVVSAKATNTNIELNVAAKLKTPVKIGVAVNDGGAKSTISTTKENISVTVTNNTEQKIKVADADGKTVTVKAGASVTANVTKGTTKKAEPVIVTETAKTDEKSKDEVSESEKDTASEQEKDSTSEQKKDTTEESKEEQSDISVKDTTSEDKKEDVSYVPPTPSYPVAHEHNWVIDVAAKKATCTEDGCTEGKHCAGCNTVIASQVEQKFGHDMQPVANTSKLNTCTEDGKESDYKCSRCEHKVEGAVIPKTGHSIVNDDAVDATCTTDGKTAGSYCSVCDTIIIKQESIKALGHDYDKEFTVDKESTCIEAGSKSRHCSRCKATTDVTEIPASGHTEVIDEAVEATCKDGLTAGSHCSVCEVVIVAQEVVPAKEEHEWGPYSEYVPETCGSNGREAVETCVNCGEKRGGETIPATGSHDWEITSYHEEPTCTKCGWEMAERCSECGKTRGGEQIPASGHTSEDVEAKAATCTEDGNEAGTKCSGCEVIEALGHTWSGAFCEVCGAFDDTYVPPEEVGDIDEGDVG